MIFRICIIDTVHKNSFVNNIVITRNIIGQEQGITNNNIVVIFNTIFRL